MQTVDGTRDLLLTRDCFFMQLDPARAVGDDVATAYLGRHGVCGDVALIGSAEMQNDGRWRAFIAADPRREGQPFQRVAHDCENRYDAIVALWLARADAFVRSLA